MTRTSTVFFSREAKGDELVKGPMDSGTKWTSFCHHSKVVEVVWSRGLLGVGGSVWRPVKPLSRVEEDGEVGDSGGVPWVLRRPWTTPVRECGRGNSFPSTPTGRRGSSGFRFCETLRTVGGGGMCRPERHVRKVL